MHALKVSAAGGPGAIGGSLGLSQFEAAARRILPPALYHYVAGGSEDEAVMERNLRAFRQHSFLPKVLVDVSKRSGANVLETVKNVRAVLSAEDWKSIASAQSTRFEPLNPRRDAPIEIRLKGAKSAAIVEFLLYGVDRDGIY